MKTFLQKELNACLDRSDFLKIMGILGISLAAPPAFATPLSKVKFNKKLHKIERSLPLMGTIVTITVLDPSPERAEEAVERGFAKIKELSQIFDRFKANTVVGMLNANGYINDTPPELAYVLKKSLYYYRLTQGAFDVTVKPLVDLLKNSFARAGKPPTEQEIKEALSLVGAHKISFDGKGIRLKDGMGLTFDGIAKGYIVDKTADLIKKIGVKYALINAGGDIRAIGKRNWKIAIRDPFDLNKYVDVVVLNDNAIATSGNYEIYFDQEKLYCHIVNPTTGLSPRLNTSTSVIVQTVADADALSTTAFVFRPLQAKRFLETIGKQALIITRQGIKIATKNWPSLA